MRIALGLEYDGRAFCGWQSQRGGCGVQDALDAALSEIGGAKIVSSVAGRTDAGVHALAQVAHFDAPYERPITAWVRGVNALLPPQAAVLWARGVDDGFHARFAAFERTYHYWLVNRPVRPALLAGRVGWIHAPLDDQAMLEAARHLVGEHDFSTFRAAQCQAKTPVKLMREVSVARHGERLHFVFRANAFLHHQVRNMVGALVWVGLGRRPPEWLGEILEARDRVQGAATFEPDGLYLAGVKYEPRWGLPEAGIIPTPFP
jgi:tRNA pseudouridine38-40 synthase